MENNNNNNTRSTSNLLHLGSNNNNLNVHITDQELNQIMDLDDLKGKVLTGAQARWILNRLSLKRYKLNPEKTSLLTKSI